MTQNSLSRRMRAYEQAFDQQVLSGMFVVARLDGRGFSKLTQQWEFEKPFDPAFRDGMVATTRHLMDCGLQVTLGYTQSDEISLLLHPECTAFGRRTTKLLSVLAGEASATLSLAFGFPAVFDCRLSPLPTRSLVKDYFRWRIADAVRSGINAHAYWALRQSGLSATDTTRQLSGLKQADKHELLHRHGIHFDDAPAWHKQGVGVTWGAVAHEGRNPITGEPEQTLRRRLMDEQDLSVGDALDEWLLSHIPERECE
jgi:tRNA(His) guanylyltransferase